MSWKGWLVAAILAFAIMFTFVFQNPVFQANFSSLFPGGGSQPEIQATPYLPAYNSSQWSTSVFAYACSGSGPGLIALSNPGSGAVTIASVSLSYNGQTYTAAAPACSAPPGQSEIFVTALGAAAGYRGSPFTGYIQTSDGSKVPFAGTWQ